MARPFRFSYQSLAIDSRAAWQDLARRVEDLGFATLHTADHVGAPDPWLPLVTAAEVTTSLRVGPLVMNLALHHPALVARAAATVDRLTDGRLELGVGTGWARPEHEATGIPLPPPAGRVDHFADALEVLVSLLRDGSSTSRGGITADVEQLGVAPVQQPHPPVLIGANGRRMIRLAAQHAQIVQLTGLVPTDDGGVAPGGFDLAQVAERVAWLHADAGARRDQIEIGALVQVAVITDDADGAVAETAAGSGLPPEVIAESPFTLIGSVAAVVEKLERLRHELGISYVTVRTLDDFAPVIAALAGR
jgi:probable F420-dependent oxidoreductase